MLRTVKAARLINKAADAFEHHGNAQAADELVSRALTALEGQTSDLAAAHTGRACQLRAEINLSRGEVDSCLHWYVKAESALSSNSRSSVLYVRFLHDAVLTLADAGMDDLAKHYVGKGLAAAVQVAGPYRHDLE